MHNFDLAAALKSMHQKRPGFTIIPMPFPIKTCAVCGEEFELRPDKPGYANRCPSCSEPEENDDSGLGEHEADSDLNAARRNAIRDLLYRKEV